LNVHFFPEDRGTKKFVNQLIEKLQQKEIYLNNLIIRSILEIEPFFNSLNEEHCQILKDISLKR
jgi:hypothetical protein